MSAKFEVGDRVQFVSEPTDYNLGTVKESQAAPGIFRVKWDSGVTTYNPEADLFLVNRPGTEDYYKTAFDPVPVAADPVEHPAHYTGHPKGIEAIDVIEDNPYPNLANVLRYCWRVSWGGKENDMQDLKKMVWYGQREISRREKVAK